MLKRVFKYHQDETNPSLGRQSSRIAHLALLGDKGQIDSSRASVACSPALSRASVRSVTICSERLAIDPGLRYSIYRLLFGKTNHFADDGCAGHFNKDDMALSHVSELARCCGRRTQGRPCCTSFQ